MLIIISNSGYFILFSLVILRKLIIKLFKSYSLTVDYINDLIRLLKMSWNSSNYSGFYLSLEIFIMISALILFYSLFYLRAWLIEFSIQLG